MSRLYYPKPSAPGVAGGDGGANGVDVGDATKKVAKLIPTELITAFAALVGAAMAIKFVSFRMPAFWICFAACWVLTPIYLNHVADAGKPKRNQLIVGSLAFPIWAYLVAGGQVMPQYYDAGIATIVALLFSLATAIVPMNK